VTLNLWQAALAGPAPVAVHDDRDVAREVGLGQEPLGRRLRGLGGVADALGTRLMRRRRRIGRASERRTGH
jgi:hypothetical protein